jgi:hypothetical protein
VTGRSDGVFAQMQAFDDAVCWRTGRLAEPCADCAKAAGAWCDEHGRDVDLIGEYRQASARLGRGAA